jgi:hypothetical protein
MASCNVVIGLSHNNTNVDLAGAKLMAFRD